MNSIAHLPQAGLCTAQSQSNHRAMKATQEFEAQLLYSILQPLESTFSAISGSVDPSSKGGAYGDMGTQAVASALATAGGIGIAKMLMAHWQRTKVL
jgi:Rod binding domain-containing protein